MRTEFLPGTDQPRSGPNTRVKSCGSSKAPSQANVHGWLPVCSTHSVALGGRECSRKVRDSGKDADEYLEILRQQVGVLPIPVLGNKLDDDFLPTGETVWRQWQSRASDPTKSACVGACHGKEKHQHGTVDTPRSHIPVVDPHDVPGGFSPTQVRGWLLLRNSRLGPQERAAILSATSGQTSFSNVSEKLRSPWSDADLAMHDRHSARTGHERRHGGAHHVNGGDDDGDDTRKPQDQLGESHDGAYSSDDVNYTAEQWDQFW